MSTIEERTAYLDNPYITKPIFGDYSAFYVTIAICTVFGAFLIVLNVVLGCCSRYRGYWQDRHTGNRWIVSIWSATPHKQPPLDLTELKDVKTFQPTEEYPEYTAATHHTPEYSYEGGSSGGYSRSFQPHQGRREEFVELHKRESDI